MKVLLMTLQNPPPQLAADAGSRHFSRSLRELVAACLQKDPAKRPSASKLLEHRFLKESRKPDYLVKHLLDGMPSLCHRRVAPLLSSPLSLSLKPGLSPASGPAELASQLKASGPAEPPEWQR
jgi:serine/threonine protein kinase